MKRIIASILFVCCLFIAGCSDADYTAEIKEEARAEGYEDGYSDGYGDASNDCGHIANNEIRDAGLSDAKEHASMIETILDAPDDFDTNDIWEHVNAVRDYLNTVDGILEQYDKNGIEH
jgi:hypothetical protein